MNKNILATMFIILCVAMGYAPLPAGEGATPVITQSFASKEVKDGHQSLKPILGESPRAEEDLLPLRKDQENNFSAYPPYSKREFLYEQNARTPLC